MTEVMEETITEQVERRHWMKGGQEVGRYCIRVRGRRRIDDAKQLIVDDVVMGRIVSERSFSAVTTDNEYGTTRILLRGSTVYLLETTRKNYEALHDEGFKLEPLMRLGTGNVITYGPRREPWRLEVA